MAGNAAPLEKELQGIAKYEWQYAMQTGVSIPDSGTWMDARGIANGSFEFANDGSANLSSFTAQIMCSNAPGISPPANSVDGTVVNTTTVSSTIAAGASAGVVALPNRARWIKVKITAISVVSGGSLRCTFQAQNY